MIAHSFYFLRHGETQWNEKRLLQGQEDTPLNAQGRQQMQSSAMILKSYPIDVIVGSPLGRVVEAIGLINQTLQKPVELSAGLMERDWGIFQGMNDAQIAEWKKSNNWIEDPDEPSILRATSPPKGEKYQDFKNRTLEIVECKTDQYPDQNILFVAHGHTFRLLCQELLGRDHISPHGGCYHFKNTKPHWELECL